MLTIIFYILVFLIVLWILEKIPGINYLVKPLLSGIGKLLHFTFLHGSLWLLWVFRIFVRSHKMVLIHFITPRDVINPSEAVRKARKKI